jgi:hypothetical protein
MFVRLRPQSDRGNARQHQFSFRLLHRTDDGEIVLRGDRVVNGAFAQAVRGGRRPNQELGALAQKVTTETFEPVKERFTKALKKAA